MYPTFNASSRGEFDENPRPASSFWVWRIWAWVRESFFAHAAFTCCCTWAGESTPLVAMNGRSGQDFRPGVVSPWDAARLAWTTG